MWNKLKSILDQSAADDGGADEAAAFEIQQAVAGLFASAAQHDGDVAPEEGAVMIDVLQSVFELSPVDAAELSMASQRAAEGALDIHQFTRVIMRHFDENQRVELLEGLWQVVYADGRLDAYESTLMRRLPPLLGVDDRQSARARQRALQPGG